MAAVALCVASRIVHPDGINFQAGNQLEGPNGPSNSDGTTSNPNSNTTNNTSLGLVENNNGISGNQNGPSLSPGYEWYGEAEIERIKDELLRVIATQKDRALGKKYSKERYKEVIKYIRQFE